MIRRLVRIYHLWAANREVERIRDAAHLQRLRRMLAAKCKGQS